MRCHLSADDADSMYHTCSFAMETGLDGTQQCECSSAASLLSLGCRFALCLACRASGGKVCRKLPNSPESSPGSCAQPAGSQLGEESILFTSERG